MTHNTLKLSIPLTLLLFFGASSAPAADDKDEKINTDKPSSPGERLILQRLSELKADIKANSDKSDAKIQEMELRLQIMADRVDRLEKSVNKMATTPRTSYFQPTPEVARAPRGSGTIVLQNTYTSEATILLNGTAHTLQPNQSVVLRNQPVGDYTYEVLVSGYGALGPVTRYLDDNRRLLIYVETVLLP
jgi:hypothetical protein